MSVCQQPGCLEHYGCRLKAKGIQLSPSATPTATLNMRPTPSEPPARNREIMYDERPGGYKMPILKDDGHVLRRKEYEENRVAITNNLRRIRSGNAS